MDPFDGVEDELEFCRDCNLPMYQIDDPKKFMVFACRACGLEEPRDYFYSLENKRINGIPVLPGVKNQGDRDTCLPTSLITVLESAIKTAKAEINEEFNQELSLDDLLMQYKEIVGIEYEHDKDDTDADLKVDRTKCLNGILVEDGVTLKDNPEGNERFKAKEVFHLKNQSFTDLAGHILNGHALKIKIPIRKVFFKLSRKGRKGGTLYIAKAKTQDAYTVDGVQIWHGVVLVGFGRKEGVEYFRYMNSHGTEFDDEGFDILRASEINEAFLIMI